MQNGAAGISKYKMINPKWTYISDNPYRILIIRGSGSGNTCLIKLNKESLRYW